MSTITKKELIGRIAENTQTKQIVVKAIIHSFLIAMLPLAHTV